MSKESVQQQAAKLWAALNIAGLDGDLPNEATVARVASAYLAATADARREGYQAAVEESRRFCARTGGCIA